MVLKTLFLASFIAIFSACGSEQSSVLNAISDRYPLGPDTMLTPGSLCARPTAHRYQERIPYCERNVSSSLKADIIRQYDEELGFDIRRMSRSQFKIDHYIPLSFGGSNERNNLWPQHQSVYKETDELEGLLFNELSAGHILQADAIATLKRAKNDLSLAEEITAEVRRRQR